jgi:hypothetical protein
MNVRGMIFSRGLMLISVPLSGQSILRAQLPTLPF